MKKGLSLVELVVSVGIIALLGVMGTSLLFGALRGSRKANAVINTQDEGAYAINIIGECYIKRIQNSRKDINVAYSFSNPFWRMI